MWQRFTEAARKTIFYSQEEAGRLGENYVSTEHILLGLVREKDTVAARMIVSMGVSLSRVRVEIESQVQHVDGRLGQDMQLTPRAKRVIDLAYEEARSLDNNYIGTEHLLLGIIKEGEGLGGRVMAKLGVSIERARAEVPVARTSPDESVGSDGPGATVPVIPSSGTLRYHSTLGRAQVIAAAEGASATTLLHLAVAVLVEQGSVRKVLTGLGVDGLALAQEWRPAPAPAEAVSSGLPPRMEDVERLLATAASTAMSEFNENQMRSDHILLALASNEAMAGRMASAGLDRDRVLAEMRRIREDEV